MNAPQLIEVSLNGYHEYGFDGQWEDFLTEPLSEIVHCLSARSPNLQHLKLDYIEFNELL